MKNYLMIVATFLLIGCSNNMKVVDAGLMQLRGAPVSQAFDILGYPDREEIIAGRKIYTWDRREVNTSGSAPVSVGAGTYGANVGLGFYAPVITVQSCRIRLITQNEQIIETDYLGDGGGCAPYAERLRPLVPEDAE